MSKPPAGRRPRSTKPTPKPTGARTGRLARSSARPPSASTGKRHASPRSTGEQKPPTRRTAARPAVASSPNSGRRADGRTAGTRRASLHTAPLARAAGRVLLPVLILTSIVVVLGYAVFPTRTWLDQRATIADREDELAVLDAEIAELTAAVRMLGTDAEIERIARVDHGLVKPGEEAYAVLPAAPEPVRMPAAWPFVRLADQID